VHVHGDWGPGFLGFGHLPFFAKSQQQGPWLVAHAAREETWGREKGRGDRRRERGGEDEEEEEEEEAMPRIRRRRRRRRTKL
jgi:hypothetical protein